MQLLKLILIIEILIKLTKLINVQNLYAEHGNTSKPKV